MILNHPCFKFCFDSLIMFHFCSFFFVYNSSGSDRKETIKYKHYKLHWIRSKRQTPFSVNILCCRWASSLLWRGENPLCTDCEKQEGRALMEQGLHQGGRRTPRLRPREKPDIDNAVTEKKTGDHHRYPALT